MGCALGLWVGVFRPVAPETGPGRTSVFLKGSHVAVVALILKCLSKRMRIMKKYPLVLGEVNMLNSFTEIHATSVGFRAPTLVSQHQ